MSRYSHMRFAKSAGKNASTPLEPRILVFFVAILTCLFVVAMATGQLPVSPVAKSASFGQSVSEKDLREKARAFEDACIAGLDHGNNGDDWLDALDDCEQAAERIRKTGEVARQVKASE